ncbi:hypothetical protein ACG33_07010 [Steroidobacter denitrificans]|uniref:Cell division protein ZipA n=1 Tax=Steroidobacter denitrificans TaxID=465721 RepID=A0A127FBC0_STEDE|nr:cell division protein ZipA C-terminal FtsZ-binding domain-containing protein [Steroidobacter denitrificans]AMN46849.1 hypothetical protein ACG33_07010 [Steroidobacter denitrificans]
MSELRWILIGFGIVLLAGIYLWGRRRTAAEFDMPARAEPGLHPTGAHTAEPAAPTAAAPDNAPPPPGAMSAPPAAAAAGNYAATVDPYMATIARPALRREPTFSEPAPAEDPPSSADDPSAADQAARNIAHDAPAGSGASPEDSPGASWTPGSGASPSAAAQTPTSGSFAETQTPRRIERRKILSLRLSAAPQRLDGAKLLETLQQEGLEHGKYKVFHLLHDGASIFSVASMVEPGIFEPELMAETEFPGITLFAQLPGPVPGMHALNELVACARRLQQCLGGTLQDDRGVPLTVHRIERLRQEIREFERPAAAGGRHPSS